MQKISLRICLTISLLFLCSCSHAIIYVDVAGNDTTGDGTIGNPYATPNGAYVHTSNGDTISCNAGTYTIATTFDITGKNNVSFVKTSGDVKFTTGNNIYFFRIYADGISIDGYEFLVGDANTHNIVGNGADDCVIKNCIILDDVLLVNCDGWTIDNNIITNVSSGNGAVVLANGSDNNTISNNVCTNSYYWGIGIGGKYGGATANCKNNIIEGNTITGCTSHGINLFESSGNIIRNNFIANGKAMGLHDDTTPIDGGETENYNFWYNNIVYNCGIDNPVNGCGISIEGVVGSKFYNNTIVYCRASGVVISSSADLTNCEKIVVTNNIFYNCGYNATGNFKYQMLLLEYSPTEMTIDNNCFYDPRNTDIFYNNLTSTGYTDTELNATNFAGNNVTADPLLTSDYKIPSNSPCVDAGLNITSIEEDYGGNPRRLGASQDIGAYEWYKAKIKAATLKGATI